MEENQYEHEHEHELNEIVEENQAEFTQQINSMEFKLVCELGSISLTINELMELKENDDIFINQNLQKIKLKINEVTIGFGELTEINGKSAVKITKLLTNLKDPIK